MAGDDGADATKDIIPGDPCRPLILAKVGDPAVIIPYLAMVNFGEQPVEGSRNGDRTGAAR